jgi:hypothetical protein
MSTLPNSQVTTAPAPVAVAAGWTGPTRRYDIVKEFTIAFAVVTVLTILLSLLFSSPDDRSVTFQRWAKADPTDFVTTALSQLDGTSGTATYGPPYNTVSGAGQKIGPIALQSGMGVQIPINTPDDFVLKPLAALAPPGTAAYAGLQAWNAATPKQQAAWTTAYSDALAKAGDVTKVPPGPYGPVPAMMNGMYIAATTGALDAVLTSGGNFFQTDYTKPLLFLADGSYLPNLAQAQHLAGDQWGMMNETGNWPGQPWLWLYTFWYQIKPFSTSGNADALVWSVMAILSLALVCVPFIPALRSLPRYLGVHRLIWRDWYRDHPLQ